ncbi:protein EMSY-LIKE 3-like [Andrographis paniculata]|uniref:protein EMSY-LIKE 3-like n=1 Tax=Andrographis paniculata TaxID=175694 RepID=UPI0021E700D7|nr:protein EMSY-LIKE 3-like [Andrographis paniculata]
MDYNSYESSEGTDDDFLPRIQNRMSRGGTVSGNKRIATAAASMSYPMVCEDAKIEAKIRQLERDGYYSALRAFRAQADSITWEKSSFITQLRKELRISNEDHIELCKKVNEDETIQKIREWRQSTGSGFRASKPVADSSFSTSQKRQKTERPSPSPKARRGRRRLENKTTRIEDIEIDPLVGKKIRTRWPVDGNFYEGIISDYDAAKDLHAVLYNMDAPNESWEWVNISEISPKDIQWVGTYPFHQVNPRGGLKGRGAISSRSQKDLKNNDEIRLLDTDVLIEEVERVFGAQHPDPVEIEKAQKVLKDQEQALVDAIAKLGALCDDEDGSE